MMSDRPSPTGDHVFISYSRKDTDFADKLRNDLRKAGFNVWIDRTGLPPGTRNWDKAIRHAINSSFAVLWLVSPNSYDSEFVQDEIAIADMLNRAIYPVWVAGENWFDCVPLGMGKSMHIDARSDNYNSAIEQIARALRGEKPELAVLPTPMPAPVPEAKLVTEPRNPYKGLRAFREEDAGDFFGRDTLIEELRYTLERRLQENRARFLAVTGPSGSGKSSIIMAGLLPRLKNGALIDSENWTYLPPIKPGAYPIEALAEALCTVLPNRTEQSITESLNNPTAAGLHILGLEVAVQRRSQRVIIFIDQFEELFTQTASEEERQQFINTLVHAVTDAGSPISVIVTMRADMYDRPMNYPQLATLLDHNSRSVLPMRLVDLREAIERPALLPDVQITFDATLVGDIVFELRDQSDALAGALPLLQFTLAQLFELRKGNVLTLDAYRALGGVRGALTKKADETYLELKGEQQQLARWLFMRLIDPGEDEQTTTRRRAALSELTLQTEQQTRMMQDVANRFVDARLLLVDQVGGVRTIEVAHEAIIREWGRLREWLQETRSDIGRMKKLAMDAAEWVRGGRRDDDDVLYRGSVLEEARRWVTNPNTAASADERAFVEAGARQQSAVDEREQQRTEEVKNASLRAMQAKQSAEAAELREKEAAKRAIEQEKRAERSRRSVSVVGGIAALIALAAVGLGIWASGQLTESTARESSANTQIAVAQVQVTQAAISLADAQNSQQA
ncbi:MAG: TIR domain-containing protein, partial [Chloroflexota bacterium]|nr:TIR domain-containing protein [Chloroflexota bacterium]